MLAARHATRYINHKQARLASERREVLGDLDEYAKLWLKQRDEEAEIYESVSQHLLLSIGIPIADQISMINLYQDETYYE